MWIGENGENREKYCIVVMINYREIILFSIQHRKTLLFNQQHKTTTTLPTNQPTTMLSNSGPSEGHCDIKKKKKTLHSIYYLPFFINT